MPEDVLTGLAKVQPSHAISFLRQREAVTTASFGELEAQAHARAFTSAGITEKRMLDAVHEALNRAVSEGSGYDAFKARFARLADQHGWTPRGLGGNRESAIAYRAFLIYQTNIATAFSAGKWARLQTPEAEDMYPWFRYTHHACPHPRPEHEAWDGIILPRDDPWWNTHWPPNGWRCHCTADPVSRRDMRRNDWTVSDSPAVEWVEKRNPATGQMVRVPKGIDLGFAYNPGKVWMDEEKRRAEKAVRPLETVGGIPKNAVPPSVLQEAQAGQIEQLLKEKAGAAEVGTLPPDVAAHLGSEAPRAEDTPAWDGSVMMSADTVGKQLIHHAEIEKSEYMGVPAMLAAPVAVTKRRPPAAGAAIGVIGRLGAQLYQLVVQRRDGAHAAELVMMHAISEADARREMRKGVLWEGSKGDDGARE